MYILHQAGVKCTFYTRPESLTPGWSLFRPFNHIRLLKILNEASIFKLKINTTFRIDVIVFVKIDFS